MQAALERLCADGHLAALDLHFARFLARLAGDASPELLLGACLASRHTAAGHVCLDLRTLAGRPIADDVADAPVAPALDRWMAALRGSSVVASPGDRRPLVLDDVGRLYLHRYWAYEHRLAQQLLARAAAPVDDLDEARLARDLGTLFPAKGTDWQRIAAATAVMRRLCVVSGGPGTGKTTTVVRILALLLAQHPDARIALAAPTGKAAARLQDAVRSAAQQLPIGRADVAQDATTVHRLLGSRPDGTFRHDARTPLPYDVVVVDEASMVDLALMAKLVDALPQAARLVLLGDRDQLASVEAGAVLGDVCGDVPGFSESFRTRVVSITGAPVPAGERTTTSPLRDAVVLLRESHRFTADSGIGQVASAINGGDGAGALALLQRGSDGVAWRTVASPVDLDGALADAVAAGFDDACRLIADGAAPAEVLAALARFRILCAHRTGPAGVDALNRLVEQHLAASGRLAPRSTWYAGRPVMVLRNDYGQSLWNGDVGVTLPDAHGRLRVWFEAADGSMRDVSPVRLPAHETVWAMTVHKSQGSEFDRVVLVLPPRASRVTTRELLYTGLTRARRHVAVWGTEAVFMDAVAARLERASGLRDALWNTA
ncbi:MAG TPA: exodeoxyribonuclease V subunit alpha [Candidatus Binatia bacterium]|jgi:exodeoxyribonuclease V alpha subunit|nr:exodeoxyribonuclease V subunit alpha [Candidatus Binatia bacterium]